MCIRDRTYVGETESLSFNFTYNQADQQTGESMYYSGSLIATVSESSLLIPSCFLRILPRALPWPITELRRS